MCKITVEGRYYYFSLTPKEAEGLVHDGFHGYLETASKSDSYIQLLEAVIAILIVSVCNKDKMKSSDITKDFANSSDLTKIIKILSDDESRMIFVDGVFDRGGIRHIIF